MRFRAAGIGLGLSHPDVYDFDFWGSESIADFDVVLFDPLAFYIQLEYLPPGRLGRGEIEAIVARRRSEARDLLSLRGGIIVAHLRSHISGRDRPTDSPPIIDPHRWMPDLSTVGLRRDDIPEPALSDFLRIRPGRGSDVRIAHASHHPFVAYMKALRGELCFDGEPQIELPPPWITFARTGTGRPVGFSAPLLDGTIVLIPPYAGNDHQKEDNVLMGCVQRMRGTVEAEPPPEWVAAYALPGEEDQGQREAELLREEQVHRAKRSRLHEQRRDLDRVKMLLYATGKVQLEEAVRHAIRLLGFTLIEDYEEAADVFAEAGEGSFVGEVEGTNGQVDVDKLRQLLDYHSRMIADRPGCKGILFGNGYKERPPDARRDEFTKAAVDGAKHYRFCLVPTCELFKAVCFVLGHTGAEVETQKAEIRRSMLDHVCVWRFEEPR